MLPECFLVMALVSGELYGWATLSEEQDRYTIYRATDIPMASSGQWVEFAVVSRKVSPRAFSKGFPHPWGAAVGSVLPGHGRVRKGRAWSSGGGAAGREGLSASRSALDEATHS
jgi:hypothetical protein